MVPLLVVATILGFVVVDILVRAIARNRAPAAALSRVPVRSIEPAHVMPPAGVFLDRGHTWLHVRPEGSVRVGASALAMKALGRPEALRLPAVGTLVQKGAPLFEVTVAGRSATFRAPLSGVVRAANSGLAESPEGALQRPFTAWFVELQPESLSEALGGLHVADKAASWARAEYNRLKDLLVGLSAAGSPAMADGGAPVEGVLAALPRADWDVASKALLG